MRRDGTRPDNTAGTQPATGKGKRRLELSGIQLLATVAAAVTGAIAASALGIGGTITGAAVVSVVATVGNALYTASLKRTKEAVKETQVVKVLQRVGPLTRTDPGDAHAAIGSASVALVTSATEHATEGLTPTDEPTRRLSPADDDTEDETEDETTVLPADDGDRTGVIDAEEPTRQVDLEQEPTRAVPVVAGTPAVYGERRRRWLSPRRLVLAGGAAALVFVLALGVLTGLETVLGRSFSSLFGHGDGRTTIGGALHPGTRATPTPGGENGGQKHPSWTGSPSAPPTGRPTPSGSGQPTQTPTTPPTPTAPPTSAAPQPTGSKAAPSEGPTRQGGGTPTPHG